MALCACLHGPQAALADAATKAREGDVNQWIEYYRRDRSPRPERSTRDDAQRPPAQQAPPHDCPSQKCSGPGKPEEPVR